MSSDVNRDLWNIVHMREQCIPGHIFKRPGKEATHVCAACMELVRLPRNYSTCQKMVPTMLMIRF